MWPYGPFRHQRAQLTFLRAIRRHASLEAAAHTLVTEELAELVERYGTDEAIVKAWAYHNATHAWGVSEAGRLLADAVCGAGELPPETVPLAAIAGAFHDHVQTEGEDDRVLSSRREELSVLAAQAAMRDVEAGEGLEPGELFTPVDHERVASMIMSTQVVGLRETEMGVEIVQNVSPDDRAGEILADADMSVLGGPSAVLRGLLAGAEAGYHASTPRDDWPTPPPQSDGSDLDPGERTGAHLAFQKRLHSGHTFHLAWTREQFPKQAKNAERFGHLSEQHAADSMSWQDIVRAAREWAKETDLHEPGRESGATVATGSRRGPRLVLDIFVRSLAEYLDRHERDRKNFPGFPRSVGLDFFELDAREQEPVWKAVRTVLGGRLAVAMGMPSRRGCSFARGPSAGAPPHAAGRTGPPGEERFEQPGNGMGG